jgi:hypothetical protein
MEEEEPKGITVGQYGVRTGVALVGQVFLEEVLNEFLERDDCGLGGLHDSTSSRALVKSANRTAACSNRTPLAVR